MELIFQITALCIISAILALVLKRMNPEIGVCLSLLVVVMVFLFIASGVGTLLDFFQELIQKSGISEALFTPVWKTIGIALVVRIGERICQDAGDSALAAVIETAGSVCALFAAMPLLNAVLETLMELIQ